MRNFWHRAIRGYGVRRAGSSLLALLLLGVGCAHKTDDRTADGRIIVRYWEKWTGAEGEAMDGVIADFNAAQTNIWVEMLTVSEITRKMMLATAGGNPPDVAGLWAANVNVYSEKNALTPLDALMAEAGMKAEDYIPSIWRLCTHRGFTWALPSTPATVALHWNKKIFREAGLDPEHPPASLDELDRMAEQLTLVVVERGGQPVQIPFSALTPEEREARSFRILRLGFSPTEPGWWTTVYAYWFGGALWDGQGHITASTPENVRAVTWYKSYADKYGLKNMQAFGSSFGNFASPQNAFLAGQVAMVIQGVWMYNFINKFAPGLEWGAAPFPSADPAQWPLVTVAETDVLVIPRGARHPREAFTFMRYVHTQQAMEKLCLGQRKFSPLKAVSEEFLRAHPNPYIKVFIDLAHSPGARAWPALPVWNEYDEEMRLAYDRSFLGLLQPEAALQEAQQRVQWKLDRIQRRWDLVQTQRLRQWKQWDDGFAEDSP